MKCFCKLSILVFCFLALSSEMLLGGVETRFMEIKSTSKPEYMKRKANSWKKRARLVGVLKNQPKSFTIEIYKAGTFAKKDLIATITVDGDINVYESDWLAPGTYDIIIKGGIYSPYKVKNIKLKPNTDCRIDIEFGTEVFMRS